MKMNVYTVKSCGYNDIVLLLLCLQSYLNDAVMRSRKKHNICMLMYNANNAKISLSLFWSSAKICLIQNRYLQVEILSYMTNSLFIELKTKRQCYQYFYWLCSLLYTIILLKCVNAKFYRKGICSVCTMRQIILISQSFKTIVVR